MKLTEIRQKLFSLDCELKEHNLDYIAKFLQRAMDAVQIEIDPEPRIEPDDRAPCRGCGGPVDDAEYEDNGGWHNDCAPK